MTPKRLPSAFRPDSEEDVRLLVARYFSELGFESDELSAEDVFSIHIGHNDIVIGAKRDRASVTARSDLLLMRQGRPFAVVELKAPDHALTDADARQGISYARLLEEIAPFAIITNGAETRAYDVLAPLSTPIPLTAIGDSSWYRAGERLTGIGDDLRYEAARVLVGVNAYTLDSLCSQQMDRVLEDLKGSASQAKTYVPDVYTPRQSANEALAAWLRTEQPCFALVGDSGLGKTTLLCATAEALATEHFVLFFRALHLPPDGLGEALRREFAWEFQHDRDPAYIISRFNDLARAHGRKFVVIIDGLDEYRHSHEALQTELRDLAQRLRGSVVRLLLSCKTHEWSEYVLDQEQTYNALARSIYPTHADVHHPTKLAQPDARHVGCWLTSFTDDEESAAFTRYAAVYDLHGRLTGTLRKECEVPLMLRLVAETYSSRAQGLPAVITSRDLYRRSWRRTMARLRKELRTEAEQLLCALAIRSIETGQVLTPLAELARIPGTPHPLDELCDQLAQAGMLQLAYDDHGMRLAGFRFRKVASYTYLMFARRWTEQPVAAVADESCRLLGTPTGAETVEMYLTLVDEGRTDVLTQVAERDFPCFTALMSAFNLRSHIAENSDDGEIQALLSARLEHYADGYSRLSRGFFTQLAERIVPHGAGDVGIWVSGSAYQLRIRTPAYPQLIIGLEQGAVGDILSHRMPEQFFRDVRPGGTIHLGLTDIVERLPEKVAWEEIYRQIGGLFGNRLLDESGAPFLLRERAWETLLHDYCAPIEGMQAASSYLELLGFGSVAAVTATPIDEILKRLRDLAKRVGMRPLNELSPVDRRRSELQLAGFCRLFSALEQLSSTATHIEGLPYTLDGLFSYLSAHDTATTVDTLRRLVPEVLHAHRALVERNFIGIAEHLPYARHRDASVLVEVARSVSDVSRNKMQLTVTYALLPHVNLPERVLVYDAGERSILAGIPMIRHTLLGHTTSQGAWGARFGRTAVRMELAGRFIDEPDASICFTSYPSHCAVLHQAYQLLGNEVQYVLQGDIHGWGDLEHGNLNGPATDAWLVPRTLPRLLE